MADNRPAKPMGRPGTKPMPGKKRMKIGAFEVIVIIIVLIAAYLVYGWAANAVSISYLGSSGSITVTSAQTVFTLGGNEYSAHLVRSQPSSGTAQISLTQLPAFINKEYLVTVYLYNSTTYVATSSQYADVRLDLNALTNSSATMTVSSVAQTAYVAPTSSDIQVVQTGLAPIGAGELSQMQTSVSTTIYYTTPTSTIQSLSYTQANAILHSNQWYPLMANFSMLYANTTNCTRTAYDNKYASVYGAVPSGPATYANATQFIPYGINMSFVQNSSNVYTATYDALFASGQKYSSGPVVILTINLTHDTVSANVLGVFVSLYDAHNYTAVYSVYSGAQGLGGACGILVA